MKRLILYGIIIFQIGLIVSLVRGMQLSMRSKARIAALEATRVKLAEEQTKLKQDEQYVQSPYYLEKVAREELHLSKPGETVVIVPEGRLVVSEAPKASKEVKEKPNWQQWWDVIRGSTE